MSASDFEPSLILRTLEFERSGGRLVAIVTALLVPGFALIAVVVSLSDEGPSSPTRLLIAFAICVTTVPVGVVMTWLVPRRAWWQASDAGWRHGSWFVAYADLGVAAVLFTFVDHETAMYGAALFVVIGGYASQFLTFRAITAHVCFSSLIVLVLGVMTWHQGHHDVAAVVARCLTTLIVMSVPVILVHKFTEAVRRTLGKQFDASARDPLTGLWNRRGFTALAVHLLSAGHRLDLIVLDVDHFKDVNDQFGHQAGDEVLALLGTRLTRIAGSTMVAGRTGGEEFAFAVRHAAGDPVALAERLRSAVHNGADVIPVTVSIGVCTSTTDVPEMLSADPAQALLDALRRADAAMYQAKIAGGNCIVATTSNS